MVRGVGRGSFQRRVVVQWHTACLLSGCDCAIRGGGESACERVKDRARERERESAREREVVCVREREREKGGERERARVWPAAREAIGTR